MSPQRAEVARAGEGVAGERKQRQHSSRGATQHQRRVEPFDRQAKHLRKAPVWQSKPGSRLAEQDPTRSGALRGVVARSLLAHRAAASVT
eukprot:scaffold82141_cov28-Tisochrysis_lutea.AAC.2